VAIGAMQLMLDRGQDQDWFTSREIITEAVFAGLGFYLFLVHIISAREPLIRLAVLKDINFSSGLAMMFMVGVLMVSSLALMTPWLQVLSNYPVETAGLIMAPRGFGSLVTTMLGGRVSQRIDARLLVGSGLVLLSYTFWLMTRWTPDVSEREIVIAVLIQGAAMGLVFSPLSVLAFVTLAPSMRTEGASLFSLLRNVGAAIGVSVFSSLLAHNSQAMHEMIGASVTPFNRALQTIGQPGGDMRHWLDPATRHGAAMLDKMVNQQAQIIAYADDYVMLIITIVPALLLLLLMRLPRKAMGPGAAE
jgi:MFS transporter, DHA2 family, multidrug resistance protein